MKKYFLLYLGFICFMSPLSWSMDDDQYGDEFGQGEDEISGMSGQNMMQNGMMPQQQSNMMYQNNMMANQRMMQNGMQNGMLMQQQSGMMFPNGTMNNQMYSQGRDEQEDETSKTEYVQSLVNNILQVKNKQRDQSFQKTKNGGTVIDRNLKNKLLKLQKDLDEISRSLRGVPQSEESTAKKSSKKSKSSVSSANDEFFEESEEISKRTKSSKKSKFAKSKTFSRKRNRRGKKLKFNGSRSFYTVKRLTPENAVKYVPKFYSAGSYSSESRKNYRSKVPVRNMSYKIKNWGTGEVFPIESYYNKNSYFSVKSKCDKGCGAQ